MLDPAGDLGLGRIGEFELVEDIARDARIVVGVPQTIEQRAGIIRARRGQFLMTGLQPERRRDRRKAGVKRHHLHFNAAFLLLVGERLTDAERRGIGGIGEPDLVVVIVGRTGPEPDGIDRRRVRPIFALGREFGLMGIDPRLVIRPVNAGDAIERVGLRDRSADKAAMKQIRAADRRAIALRGGIRLPPVEWLGGVKEIGIARDAVVSGLAAIGVGVERVVAASGIDQDGAIHAAIDGIDSRSGFDRHTRSRFRRCEWGFGGQSVGLERCGRA